MGVKDGQLNPADDRGLEKAYNAFLGGQLSQAGLQTKISNILKTKSAKTIGAGIQYADAEKRGGSSSAAEFQEELIRRCRMLRGELRNLWLRDSEAKVGYRGSGAMGERSIIKKNLSDQGGPIDPQRVDVDAFVVSDKLAEEIPTDAAGHRQASMHPDLGGDFKKIEAQIQKEIESNPPMSTDGARLKEPVRLFVYTEQEFANKTAPTVVDRGTAGKRTQENPARVVEPTGQIAVYKNGQSTP